VTEPAEQAAAGRRIDLDAARKARLEKKGPAPVVHVAGQDWTLPLELPADVVTAVGMLTKGDVSAFDLAVDGIFGGQLEAIKVAAQDAGQPLSWDDVVFLLESVVGEYGIDLPGSSASGRS
jgi:hypothetical protein